MPWLELHLSTERQRAPQLEDRLLACGALSVTLADEADDPILEPGVGETPLWQTVHVSGLFDADTDRQAVLRGLAELLPPDTEPHWRTLEDQAWERAWMDEFEPIRCGERLWICPSWREPPEPAAVNLRLDPGLAFGSGTHPTTFLCLQWLDALDLAGKTVVDYGCGSGILGIAALLLGAERVVAVDNDPQALTATRDNLARNDLADERLTACLPGQIAATAADLVVANILAGPLVELAPVLSRLTRTGGLLCLSGLTPDQADTVAAAYSHFQLTPAVEKDGWVRLTGIKQG